MTFKSKKLITIIGFVILTIAAANVQADTCPKGSLLPVPDNVKVFQQQVRASLRAALRGKSDALVMTEIRDIGSNLSANAAYCAKGSGSPLAISVEARYVGTISIDDGKRAIGVIDIRDREKDAVLKTPLPAEISSEVSRILTEREAISDQRKREFSNRNDPRYKEASDKMYQLQLKSEQLTKPHREAMEKRVRDEVDSKYSSEIQRLTYAPTATITLTANNFDFQKEPWLFIGTKGSTNAVVTRVKKVAVELGTGTTDPVIVKMMQDLATPVVDRARLQAMVDGKLTTAEESTALFAQQADDMKTGMVAKREIDKSREALEAAARRARQAERNGKPETTAPVATSTPLTNQTQNSKTENPPNSQVQAQPPQQTAVQTAPQPQAPAVTPANVVNGLNQLKGLFGR